MVISYHHGLFSSITIYFCWYSSISAGSLDLTIEASNDITNISDTFTLNWDVNDQNPKSIPEEKINRKQKLLMKSS